MKLSLEKQILLFAFVTLFATIVVITSLDILGFRKDYNQALIMRSLSLATSMKISVEKVLALGVEITALEGIQERCSEIVLENQEIAFCLITDANGKPLYFNDPQFARIWPELTLQDLAALANRQTSLLTLKGERYYNTITRLNSPDGIVSGYVLVGFNSRVVSDKLYSMTLRSVAVLVLALLASFTLVVYFARRSITRPLQELLGGVRRISEGDLSTRIGELNVREFNELALNINFMSESLKIRDDEIRQNYGALEQAHRDLGTSYAELERLSTNLERSEELYKALLEDASDAILVFDHDEVVTMINKMAEEFFGYHAREVVGLPLTKLLLLLNVEDVPGMHAMFRKAVEGRHGEVELHFTSKGGEELIGLVHANAVTSGDSILVQAIVRDVTRERHVLANLEKSAADLARLNAMKDSFLGLASHELKTPLTVIMGYAELLLSDMAGSLPTSAREMVENISRASQRLDTIVRDMVDVSMIDERRLRLSYGDVDVNRLVEEAADELKLFTTMRNLHLHLELGQPLPLLKADPVRLNQLLTNVMVNAIKFTPDGGSITVTTRIQYLVRTPVGHPQAEDLDQRVFVEITVADSGIGIDQDDLSRIFDKFYEVGNIQQHSTGRITFNAKGAGLGLTIAKGIAEMHGGTIWAESPGYDPVNNPGSTFHILLPLHPDTGGESRSYLEILS
jgi:hypothetical protein